MLRRVARKAALACCALAAIVASALAFGAPVPIGEAFVLHPRHLPLSVWRAHAELHPFVVRAADGTALRGWILDGTKRNAPWTLTFTGNAGTAQSMVGIGRWFARRTGSTTVLWDYRGFGFSDGAPGIMATRADALRVYDAMRTRSHGNLVVYGHSFGTTIATRVAAARPVRALVLHAAPASATRLFTDFRDLHLPSVMRRLRPMPAPAIRENFDLAAEVRGIRAPTIVLHGTRDALIPIAEGRAVEAASGARIKRFVALPGVEHATIDYDTPGGAALVAFLNAI